MSNYLLEIGLEEMPAHLVTRLARQLVERMNTFLEENRLEHGTIKSYSTPRRLAILVEDLADASAAMDEELRGPSLQIAKNDAGEWSKAAEGFARGQSATTADLTEKDGYIYLSKHTDGLSAQTILSQIGSSVVEAMTFSTYMKWRNFSFEYIRPIKWLVSLLDQEVVPFDVLNIQAGNQTCGHRFLADHEIALNDATAYVAELTDNFVMVDAQARKQTIREQLDRIATSHEWHLPVDEDLLEEVVNIVEWPTAFAGDFDQKYLELPDEVLITSMREHQRFFYVTDAEGKLLPHFVSVRNGNDHAIENVIAGNERVLISRLEDAAFFWHEDQKRSIDYFMEKVQKLSFHDKIGSVAEHMQRTGMMAEVISDQLAIDAQTQQDLKRAAEIYKFDLMTGMVGEFDELQGIMGERYALIFGENKQVAQAIREHYLPTSSEGELPVSQTGAVLALADKLDSLFSFFSVGLQPNGANDPYGLRRAALGVVRILADQHWSLDLVKTLQAFADASQTNRHGLPTNDEQTSDEINAALIHFFDDRIRQINKKTYRKDVLDAALADGQTMIVADRFDRLAVLNQHLTDADFKTNIEAAARIQNLAKKNPSQSVVQPELFENDAEKQLFEAGQAFEPQTSADAYEGLVRLVPQIQTYLEETMVMAEQENLKNNRLAQVNHLANKLGNLGDLTLLNVKD